MPHETMPKSKSVEPISVLLLPSPALLLAEAEAQVKAKAPRLRAQQGGRVATRKKGRLRAALRHLWVKIRVTKAYSEWIEGFRPSGRSHYSGEADPPPSTWGPPRKGEPVDPMLRVPSEEKKG